MRLSHSTPPKAAHRQPAADARRAFLAAQPFAHRGLHGPNRPENSRAACAAAVAAGHGIEIDVQLSADGVPVVFHDTTLDRMTPAHGAVRDTPLEVLARLRLAGTNETIPTLADILALVAGRVPVLIELKPIPHGVQQLCLAVRRALEGYRGDVAVMSFDPRVGQWFATHAERIVRGLVLSLPPWGLSLARLRAAAHVRHMLWRARPDLLAVDVATLPHPLVAKLRARGTVVLAWTVRSAAEERLAFATADEMIYERASD